jgi:hypothetical protein
VFNRTWRSVILVAGETALLVAAVVISSIVIGGDHAWELVTDNTAALRVLLIVLVCQVCLHYTDLYDLHTIQTKRDLATRLMRAIGATSLILGIAYWLFPLLVVEQGVFLLTAALAIVLVMAWRSAFDVITSKLMPRERLLLVGTSPAATGNWRRYRRLRRSRPDSRRRAGAQSRGRRHDRRYSRTDVAHARRSRGGQPFGSARQAADGATTGCAAA